MAGSLGDASYDIDAGDGADFSDENASDTVFVSSTDYAEAASAALEPPPAASAAPASKKTTAKKSSEKKTQAQQAQDEVPTVSASNTSPYNNAIDALDRTIPAVAASDTPSDTPVAFLPLPNPVTASSVAVVAVPCLSPLSVATTSKEIIVNEIAWMGSLPAIGETASAAANDEWIELKNISGSDIALNGWAVLDSASGITVHFASSDHIAAGGFFLLARGDGGSVSLIAQKIYSGNLPNTGDQLALLDSQCAVSDFVDASLGWPGGDNATKQTLERNAGGNGWHTSLPAGGTPGAENSAGVPLQQPLQPTSTKASSSSSSAVLSPGGVGSSDSGSSGSGTDSSTATASGTEQGVVCSPDHAVIMEIQTAGAVSSNDLVKLYNPTGAAIAMDGWKLRKKSQTGTDGSLKALGAENVIPPGGYFTWANSANGFAQSIGADVSSTETLAANNSVALMDASGTIIDEVAWGTGTNQYVEGTAFAANPAANQLLERKVVGGVVIDTDDNATDFALH